MRHKNHADPRVRERFHRESKSLKHAYAAMLWAMEYRLKRENPTVAERIRTLRREVEREFGLLTAAVSRTLGPVLWLTSLREDYRLARGKRHEPATIAARRNWTEAARRGAAVKDTNGQTIIEAAQTPGYASEG
jgi:hypothetical protein